MLRNPPPSSDGGKVSILKEQHRPVLFAYLAVFSWHFAGDALAVGIDLGIWGGCATGCFKKFMLHHTALLRDSDLGVH